MYKIIADEKAIAIVEKLQYIRKTEKGVFVSCTEREAQGVAIGGKAYNLLGRESITEGEAVIVAKVDGGKYIFAGEENQTDTDAIVVDHEYRLTLLEMGVI